MHPRKKRYANEVFNMVSLFCSQLSEDKREPIPVVLKISVNDAREIIRKVIIALPDEFFYKATNFMLYDMLALISKHLVLFQAQENLDDDDYAYHLLGFINGLSLMIAARYYPR